MFYRIYIYIYIVCYVNNQIFYLFCCRPGRGSRKKPPPPQSPDSAEEEEEEEEVEEVEEVEEEEEEEEEEVAGGRRDGVRSVEVE